MTVYLVTAARMREMDRETIEEVGIPGIVLMETAGAVICRSIVRRVPGLSRLKIAVVCGAGNNGGDGFVVARKLRELGLWPRILLTVPRSSLRGDAAITFARALDASLDVIDPPKEDADTRSLEEHIDAVLGPLEPHDLIVDALLGTGASGPPRPIPRAWIEGLNRCRARVVSVDLPSGAAADHGMHPGAVVRAEWTVSLAHAKLGAVLAPGSVDWGEVDVGDIGIPAPVSRRVGPEATLATAAEVGAWLPHPGPVSHKGDWGKLLVVGGSPGLSGAPLLASRAALRMGIGLLRLALPASLARVADPALLEAMMIPLAEGEDGQALSIGAERILGGFGDWDGLVLGPGLGRSPEAERLVLRLLGGWRGPLVIDADGLNVLAAWGPDSWVPRAREVRAAGAPGGLILTPHPGEMQRLSGLAAEELRRDPVAHAREWACRWGVTLHLKGAPSVTASPDGLVWVNGSGNAGLATGGSGDVLSGVIGALLAQGVDGPRAAALGAFLHGLAADLAVEAPAGARRVAERSLLPTDVIEALPSAIRHLEEGRESPRCRLRNLS